MTVQSLFLILSGYLVGSIPSGYLIAKFFGNINIKEVGSGNIGATNITRVMGKKYGTMTLLADGLKALFFMLAVKTFIEFDPSKPLITPQTVTLCLCGLAVLLGNCYSLFLKFTGGKGGVTTYGVFLSLAPFCSLIAIITYIVSGKFFKISAVGTLSSVVVLPLMISLTYPHEQIKPYMLSLAVLFTLIVWIRHTKNIQEIKNSFFSSNS